MLAELGPLVYAIRVNGLIKIGYTGSFQARMRVLRYRNKAPVEILAVKQGTLDDEQALHQQLKPDRVRGDYYHPTPAVVEAVNGLRDWLHLDPISS